MKVKQAVISCFSIATHLSLHTHTHTDLMITAPVGNDEMREAGGDFSFNCTAEVQGNASGAVDFFWERGGVNVSNTSTLTLNSVTQDSTGVYTCVAATSFLTRSANLTLTVIGQYEEWVHGCALELTLLLPALPSPPLPSLPSPPPRCSWSGDKLGISAAWPHCSEYIMDPTP